MINILLAEGQAAVRLTLRQQLGAAAEVQVAGEVGTTAGLGAWLSENPNGAHLLLLDLALPGAPDNFALLPDVLAQCPQLRLLGVGDLQHEQYVGRAFQAGLHGYLLRDATSAELLHAVRTVAGRRPYLTTTVGLAVLRRYYAGQPTPEAGRLPVDLSKRELEVLSLVAEGYTNAQIAERLFASKRTIETHRQNIITKTQAKNTAALIRLAVNQGLLPG